LTMAQAGPVAATWEHGGSGRQDDGRRKVEAHLAEMPVDWGPVIVEVQEFPVGWIFQDSKIHNGTQSLNHARGGNAPILVDRSDGSPHSTGTGRPIEENIERYLARDPSDERSWRP
jgi:hypothetical protein